MDARVSTQKYMKLQSIPLSKITIQERNELQKTLDFLIKDEQTTEHDLYTYYMPRWQAYDREVKQIKAYVAEQIAQQEAIIMLAQKKIYEIRKKLHISISSESSVSMRLKSL